MNLEPNVITSLILVIVAVFALKYGPRLLAGVPYISAQDLKKRLESGEDLVIVDVRTPREYEQEHVPDAVNLPLGEIQLKLRTLGAELTPYKSLPVVLMCRTDRRASQAVRAMKKAGFDKLCIMTGGIGSWKRSGYPTA